MTDNTTFEGQVVPMEWGKSVYTVLPIPDDVAETLQAQGAKRVEGEINDHPVNLAIATSPAIDGFFLWAGKSLLDEIGIAPGDRFEVTLRKANADKVEMPDDVILALRQAERSDLWNALTPGKQRGLLHGINTAKRPETRIKRITKMVSDLS